MCTFARYDYTIHSTKEKEKLEKSFQRQFLDLIENDERIKKIHWKKYKTFGYTLKLIVANLFYITLAFALGNKEEIYLFLILRFLY
jgi:hypothetical protein